MSITMRQISRFIAETLNDSLEFKTLSNSLISAEFNYYVNVDIAELDEVPAPYFSVVTFEDKDEKETKKAFQTILLVGIERDPPVKTDNITEEPTLKNLEDLVVKAMEIIANDLRIFGVNTDKNIKISYINMYVPNPDGEDDLQMQVDIEFEQDKYISC